MIDVELTTGVVALEIPDSAQPVFITDFSIGFDVGTGGIERRQTIHITSAIVAEDQNRGWRSIEDECARSLPEMLRQVADALQAQIDAGPRDFPTVAHPIG